jgi:methylisocitrate lyase
VANTSFGLPDLGMTSLDNALEDARRITDAVDTPLLVDIDTGFGAFNILKPSNGKSRRGSGVHIEDQVAQKRAVIAQIKEIVSISEMVDRLKPLLMPGTVKGLCHHGSY